jgi:hypothetical protein
MTFEKPNDHMPTENKETIQAERITLLPESSHISIEKIIEHFGEDQKVIVCDFYLDNIESRGEEKPYGLQFNNIINIDHHAPIRAMERPVSSSTLAIDYVKEFGTQKESTIVVNHTDCDSTLSSSIIRGALPPDQKFSNAAIAADHTGESNQIADLLQALDARRDLDFSLRNLSLLLNGQKIEEEAAKLLEKRLNDRERAQSFVDSGAFKFLGPIAYAETDTNFDGAFLPSLLPESSVILLGTPIKDKEDKSTEDLNEVKVRLGNNGPKGLTLASLHLGETDIHCFGRWNAMSNRRFGGTKLSIEECAKIVADSLSIYSVSK